jgi:hypothetical protein
MSTITTVASSGSTSALSDSAQCNLLRGFNSLVCVSAALGPCKNQSKPTEMSDSKAPS